MSDRRPHREHEADSEKKKPASKTDTIGHWLMAGLLALTVIMAALAPTDPEIQYDQAPIIF